MYIGVIKKGIHAQEGGTRITRTSKNEKKKRENRVFSFSLHIYRRACTIHSVVSIYYVQKYVYFMRIRIVLGELFAYVHNNILL